MAKQDCWFETPGSLGVPKSSSKILFQAALYTLEATTTMILHRSNIEDPEPVHA